MKAGWEKQRFVLPRADTVSRALQTRLLSGWRSFWIRKFCDAKIPEKIYIDCGRLFEPELTDVLCCLSALVAAFSDNVPLSHFREMGEHCF